MILLQNVTKFYKTDFWKAPHKALDEVTFTIKENSITGFLGANGAGKTTTIKIILGITNPNNGIIDYSSLGKSREEFLSNLGYMPERPYYYQHVTGREFITYLAKINQVSKDDTKDRLVYLANRLDLTHALDRAIRTYSKGMLQRLGLISALIHRPKLIILDEPVSGLDPIGRKDIKDILKDLNKKEGVTIFFSTHIIPDVEEICDELIFLEKGRLVHQGKINQILKTNEQDYYITHSINNHLETSKTTFLDKEKIILELIKSGHKIEKVTTEALRLEDFLYGHK